MSLRRHQPMLIPSWRVSIGNDDIDENVLHSTIDTTEPFDEWALASEDDSYAPFLLSNSAGSASHLSSSPLGGRRRFTLMPKRRHNSLLRVKTCEMPRVCVTDATSFLGSWVVSVLLQGGYRVRGAVSAPLRYTNAPAEYTKVTLETELAAQALCRLSNADRCLELVEVNDVFAYDAYYEAVRDCDYVIHTAMVGNGHMPKCAGADREWAQMAINGTLNLLQACAKPGSKVKRVVFSSSIASVCGGERGDDEAEKRYTGADWNEDRKDWFGGSRVAAEKAAWAYVGGLENEGPGKQLHRFELVSVVTAAFIGPSLDSRSCLAGGNRDLLMLCRGFYILNFKISLPFVDVRDCAFAHMAAMLSPYADGKREISVGGVITMHEICDVLRKRGCVGGNFNLPTTLLSLPNPLARIVLRETRKMFPESLLSGHFSHIRPSFPTNEAWDSAAHSVTYRPIQESVFDVVCNFVRWGFIELDSGDPKWADIVKKAGNMRRRSSANSVRSSNLAGI